MLKLTRKEVEKLKASGFAPYEISHYKAGRYDRIAKEKLRRMHQLVRTKKRKKKTEPKPILISKSGVRLKKNKNIIIINLR